MITKTVYYAAGSYVYAFTLRETEKCWVLDADADLFLRNRRFSKDLKEFPWRDTPQEAAVRLMHRKWEHVSKVKKQLDEAEAEYVSAAALVRSAGNPGFLVENRTVGAPINDKRTHEQLQLAAVNKD